MLNAIQTDLEITVFKKETRPRILFLYLFTILINF